MYVHTETEEKIRHTNKRDIQIFIDTNHNLKQTQIQTQTYNNIVLDTHAPVYTNKTSTKINTKTNGLQIGT